MKPINFTPSIPAHEQRSVRIWLIISTIMMSVTGISITAITLHNWYVLHLQNKQKRVLLSKTTVFESVMQEKQKLTQEKKVLLANIAQISPQTTSPKNPLFILQTIAKAAGQLITINTIQTTQKLVEICGSCKTTQEALSFVDTLAQTPLFTNSALTSIRPEINNGNGSMRFTVKVHLNEKQPTT